MRFTLVPDSWVLPSVRETLWESRETATEVSSGCREHLLMVAMGMCRGWGDGSVGKVPVTQA